MVALLIRFRFAMLRNRRNGGQTALAVIVVVFAALAALGSASVGLADFDRPGATADVLALTSAAWGLLWLVSPLLFGAMDNTLKPTYFALLPVPPRRLARSLLVVSLVGVMPALAVVALAGPVVRAAVNAPAALVAAIPAVLLAAVFTVLATRVLTIGLTAFTASRHGRDVAMVASIVLGAAIWLAYMGLQIILPQLVDGELGWLSSTVRYSPYGWATMAAEAAADGQWLAALGWVAALAGAVGVLACAWFPLMERQLAEPMRGAASHQGSAKSGGRRLLPSTPVGAVASKELAMYRRDARRQAALLIVPMFLLLGLVGPFLSEAFRSYAAMGLYGLAFGGIAAGANLYGLDGPGLWQVLVAPNGARADIRGKQLAWLIVIAPVLVLFTALRYPLFDRGVDALAFDIATVVALLGLGVGAIVYTSTHAAYPVPPLKENNPFSTRGSFNAASLGSLLLMVAGMVVVGLAVWAPSALPGAWAWVAVPVGAVIGVGCWLLGTRLAVRRLWTHGPELLAVVRKQP